MIRTCKVILALLLMTVTAHAQNDSSQWEPLFRQAFCHTPTCDPADETQFLRDQLSERKSAGWSIERRIRAIANMFEVTGEVTYLRLGMAYVSLLYGIDQDGHRRADARYRDDLAVPPIVDGVRHRVMLGWSSYAYGVPSVSAVQTGLVMAASVRIANLVLARKDLSRYYPWARKVRADSGNALTLFTRTGELTTITDGPFNKKTYIVPVGMADIDCYAPTVAAHWQRACLNEKEFAGREVPFNQSLALGLLALELFRYDSDNASLAALLVGLTNDFLINSNIHVGPDGGAHWLYWSAPQSDRLLTPAARATHRRFEDTAHGNIVVSYLMLFAHQQNRILQTAGAANPLVHRITPEFLATLSHSVHIERSEGKILVDRTMGERPRQDTTSAANARLLQQWCLLSSALRDTCQLAARQTKDPVVISYAALAQTHGH